ncbi:hypothetical protein C2S51_009539 [Perilla frutescens var. frutescens]|nr:hypothetical protein C2S51_009539 [Perilla frutescens var. frutescens]
MEFLRSSCFRHLFTLPEIKFQGHLFNVLLRKLNRSSLGEHRLSFDIRGRRLDFTPFEFALVTGLKFKDWVEPPVESEIHRVVFRGKPSLILDDVVDAFNKECRSSSGTSHLSLQLVCLVILYGVLLVCGASSHNIDMIYLHLADDIHCFNAFPWGKVAYHLLVRRTHRAKEQLETLMRNNRPLALDGNGFVFSLQVWAYEVLLILARNCADRIAGSEDRLPRMLRWSARKAIKFDLMNRYFLNATPDSLTPMVPDNEIETEFLHLLGVDNLTSDPVFQKDEHISSISPQKGMSSLECEAEDPSKMKDQPTYLPQQSPLPHSPVEPTTTEVQLLSRCVADLEHLLADFMCSSGGGEKGLHTTVADSPNKVGIVDAALTHMDALIGLLLFNAVKEPGRFGDGRTTMEMFCWGALEQSNFQTVHDRRITVYDSLSGSKKGKAVSPQFENVSKNICRFCDE